MLSEARRGSSAAARWLIIERVESSAISPAVLDETRALRAEAYDEDFSQYFAKSAPAVHPLGWEDGRLVAHAMWITRELHVESAGTTETAYVEAVATRVGDQGRGHATRLMQRLASRWPGGLERCGSGE